MGTRYDTALRPHTSLIDRARDALDNPLLFNLLQFLVSGRQERTRRILRRELDLQPGEPLLDVCCGTGEFAGIATGPYLGIDLNPRYVAYARRTQRSNRREVVSGRSRRFLVADVNHALAEYDGPPFPKGMMINSLHHLSNEEAKRLLRAVSRIVTGRFVVVDMDPKPGNRISRFLARLDRGDHIRSLNGQVAALSRYFEVEQAGTYYSGLCGQTLIVCSTRGAKEQQALAHATRTAPGIAQTPAGSLAGEA